MDIPIATQISIQMNGNSDTLALQIYIYIINWIGSTLLMGSIVEILQFTIKSSWAKRHKTQTHLF
jgi:hypothetical protein